MVTTGQYGSNLSVTFGYNSYGYPTSTVAGTIQNYSYNFNTATGDLNWRQNNKYTGLKEDFYYDNLDRLDYIMKGTTTTLDMAYFNDKGGILSKSDIGSYFYNHSSKHYALTEITPKSAMIPNTSESITYTSFECVKTILEDPYSASFVYNADNQRAKMEVKQNTTTILTRWYPESSYSKETASGTTKEYTFIGGDPYTAPVVAITQSGTTTYYYLLRDHLGSITHVVDATSGTLSYQYSYDAWGWMRNVSTWTNYGSGSEPSPFVAGRSFTGHEYLPWFNLINMNGRMYDPLVGQFLSPDNNIQDPYNSQNLNRYSYCMNNPLRYSDFSGNNITRIPPENWSALFYAANLGASASDLASAFGDGYTYADQDYLDYLTSTFGLSGGNGGWLFKNENIGYNYMWLASHMINENQPKGMEHCAWITNEGVFVHPTSGKDWRGNDLHNTWRESYVNYYQTTWEIGNKLYFNDPILLGKIEVIGLIHTHLPGDVDLGFSPGDNAFSQWMSGIPVFLMDSDGSLYGQYWNGQYNAEIKGIEGRTRKDLTNQYYNFHLIPFLKKYGQQY